MDSNTLTTIRRSEVHSNRNLYLYHGTDSKNRNNIKREGLIPRVSGEGTWTQIPSRPGFIYFTRAYALYYADAGGGSHSNATIFRTELAKLDETHLYPDEDFLSQVLNCVQGILTLPEPYETARQQGNRQLTDLFRLEDFQDFVPDAIRLFGSVAYKGSVPADALEWRTLRFAQHELRYWIALDALPWIANYRFVGSRLRLLMDSIFCACAKGLPESLEAYATTPVLFAPDDTLIDGRYRLDAHNAGHGPQPMIDKVSNLDWEAFLNVLIPVARRIVERLVETEPPQ
jgi:hypothetical protein